MIYGLEKLDRVINKIIRDLGLGQEDIPFADFVEWIADALEHIGAYYQLQEKSCIVKIENHEGLLPCDFYKMIRLSQGCQFEQATDGGFYAGSLVEVLAKAGVDFEKMPAYERYVIVGTKGLQRTDINDITQLTGVLNFNKNLIGNPKITSFTKSDINISGNRVMTAFPCGFLQLQYLAMPVDERGWPLVPDNVSFRDAMFWKCAYQLSMRSPDKMPNPRMKDLEYCKQKWNFYCVQARAEANMPDLAMLERFANQWMRLLNVTDLYTDGYRSLGKPSNLTLEGRR